MDLRHFEDLKIVVETRSFSKAAKMRGVSTSSLTRRIYALEQSFNIQLIDRSTYPTQLTPEGQEFYQKALDLLSKIDDLRQHDQKANLIRFSMPPHLASHFFPKWLYALQTNLGVIPSHVHAGTTHESNMRLIEHQSDFWLAYHHPLFPVLAPTEYAYITLKHETFAPYSCVDWNNQPMHVLANSKTLQEHGLSTQKAAFLNYQTQNYFRKIVDQALVDKKAFALDQRIEANTVDALKAMVLQGHGLAFLPETAISDELEKGTLIRADIYEPYACEVEVRLYRGINPSMHVAHQISNIWCHLVQKHGETL